MPVTAREAALKALAAFRKRGVWPETMLGGLISGEGLSPRDAALASNIAGGVLQNMALLDFYISSFSTYPPDRLEPMVADIMRLSAYQLAFLTRVPAHAAVSEGVELAKKYANPRASSLVNAVLRKIASSSGRLPEPPRDDEAKYLSVRYSHPEWLVRELLGALGSEGCRAFLESDNTPPPVTAQVNTLKCSALEALLSLEADGASAEKHAWLETALTIQPSGDITRLRAFSDGLLYVQDAAARLAVTAADIRPGMTVLDGCAAPGGKSFAAAVDMENSGRVVSCDLHENKLRRISDGAARLGITVIETLAADGRAPYSGLLGSADRVLADVPCSGLGVIRKKPDIRYKPASEIAGLPDIQLDILRGLSKCVKPGGVLVYSTCTVLKRENEDVCRRFLEENSGFCAEAFELPEPVGRIDGGMATLWPQNYGTDGFFICRMRKKT